MKFVVFVSAIATALFFGGTYAANININSGTATEFGQGVLSTVVCGGDPITVRVPLWSLLKIQAEREIMKFRK